MHILVVDDHALFREGLVLLLRQMGEQVDTREASSAEEALHQLDLMSEIDLLLIDLGMPGIDGIDLLSALRERGLDCPVVVISASEELHDIQRALAAGAQSFIPKSTSSSMLLDGLQRVLQGEDWLPREIHARLRQRQNDTLPELTRRQQHILEALTAGDSNAEIAQRLNISVHTVKFHLATLFRLLDARNRTECVTRARELGLVRRKSMTE